MFTSGRHGSSGEPTGLAGRDFLLLLAATLGTFSNYAPLLSVAPLWVVQGGGGHGAAGATTGVTMGTTVAAQLCMDWVLRRFSRRGVLGVGALLLGVPAFGYALSSSAPWVLGLSAVRGAGFGMITVAGSALVAELVPAPARGRAVGWYGVAVGLPQVVCLPLGVFVAQNYGFTPVFLATGALGVLAVPLVAAMPSGRRTTGGRAVHGPKRTAVERIGPLAGPWAMMLVSACALGGVTTFLPLALDNPRAAPTALFALSAMVIAGRWTAGVVSDRSGSGRLLVPSLLCCAVGMAGFALATGIKADVATVAVAAAVAYGVGFGALQNETLVVMFRRAGTTSHGTASMAWNMALDAGTGIGAVGVGLGSQSLDVSWAFAAIALLIAVVLPIAWAAARREGTIRRADITTPGRRPEDPHPEISPSRST